jgi:hypothetical protein
MGDQHHSRTIRDMAIIGDVNQEFIKHLGLDPAVKDRDKLVQVHLGGCCEEDFEIIFGTVHR